MKTLKIQAKERLITALIDNYPENLQADYALTFLRHIHGSEWAVVRWIIWGKIKSKWGALIFHLPTKKNRGIKRIIDN